VILAGKATRTHCGVWMGAGLSRAAVPASPVLMDKAPFRFARWPPLVASIAAMLAAAKVSCHAGR